MPNRAALDPHSWLRHVRYEIDRVLAECMQRAPNESHDAAWVGCRQLINDYATRPAKRVRSALLLSGFSLASGQATLPPALWTFAAGVELLHTFMLVHDDIADKATRRRNAPALHLQLGDDVGVVAGDYLFARAVELMLGSGATHAAEATRYYLQICRETAAGQALDLQVARVPLRDVSLFRAIEIANLKTARYSFVAPLCAGALLAGADASQKRELDRIGRVFGLSYQFVDDLIGMFGDTELTGKPNDGDFLEGKRTFPVVAGYARANGELRREMEKLWDAESRDPADLAKARSLIIESGGRAATERVIKSAQRAANAALAKLPSDRGHRSFLQSLNDELSRRQA